MNELTFQRWDYTLRSRRTFQNRWKPGPPRRIDMIVPLIDGRTVKEILRHDGVAGLPSFYVEPRSTHWSGAPNYGDNGQWAIIDGGCDVVGCCGVQADITVEVDTVRWSNFRIGTEFDDETDVLTPWQQHSRRSGPEFVFDRSRYMAAIDGIGDLPPVAVSEKS